MDAIYLPDRRKWISPLINLGSSIKELKDLVRLKNDSLHLINPEPHVPNGHRFDFESNWDNVTVQNEGVDVAEDDEDIDSAVQRLTNGLKKSTENKWSESDAACEAAVDALGGSDFFESEEKLLKKQKKLERERKLASSRRKAKVVTKGKRKKNIDGDDDDIDSEMDLDEEEMLCEFDEEEPCSSRSRVTRSGTSSTKPTSGTGGNVDVDSALYEEYNYNEEATETEPTVSQSQKPQEEIDDYSDKEEEEYRNLETLIPLALDESDEGEEDYDMADRNFLNDDYVNSSERHELNKLRYKEYLPSDSDASEEEEERIKRVRFSDEEDEDDTVNTRALVLVNPPPSSPVPGPSRSAAAAAKSVATAPQPKKKRGRKKKLDKKPRLEIEERNIFEEDLSDPEAIPEHTDCANHDISSVDAGKMSDLVIKNETTVNKDPTADFKRFTEWVFERTLKTDKEQEARHLPGLMTKLRRKESEIKHLQRVTSASRATAKGEVFQDDPVMKSSCMPLLAPPLDPSASNTLQALAVFIVHGDDPSSFPWKSINVQQQINDDFAYDDLVKRMEQQKIDVVNPAMADKVVNKEEDFLVEILVYQATDPEDVLPDEIKLRRRDEEAEINMAGGNDKFSKSRGHPGSAEGITYTSGGLNRYIEPRLAYELHMLGSQTVGDLMNAIHCENDYIYMEDVPHPSNFKDDPAQYAKNKFPASMLMIDNKIYIDPTKAHETDYVTLLNDWVKRSPKKRLGPFYHGNLNTKLKDLDVRFGFPYAYIHFEGCEHVFVITKARLLHTQDEHLVENYPKIIGLTKFKNIYCRVDNEYLARWAVTDFKEFPEDPMLLCTECVTMYCYDQHKKKRGDFKLFPLIQIANLL